jgi:hypothetical protein
MHSIRAGSYLLYRQEHIYSPESRCQTTLIRSSTQYTAHPQQQNNEPDSCGCGKPARTALVRPSATPRDTTDGGMETGFCSYSVDCGQCNDCGNHAWAFVDVTCLTWIYCFLHHERALADDLVRHPSPQALRRFAWSEPYRDAIQPEPHHNRTTTRAQPTDQQYKSQLFHRAFFLHLTNAPPLPLSLHLSSTLHLSPLRIDCI